MQHYLIVNIAILAVSIAIPIIITIITLYIGKK